MERPDDRPTAPTATSRMSDVPGLRVDDVDTAQELLALATAAAGIGTFDWDLVTGRLSWDDRLLELFGYDSTTFDRSIEAFNARLHPDDLARVSEVLQHTIDGCGDYEAEYRVLHPDGTQRWLAARGRALCDEAGATVRLLGAAWDVTSRRETQDRVADILEDMAVGFIAMAPDWVITHVNAEAERISGMTRADLLGASFWERFPATVGTEFEAAYRRAATTAAPVSFDAFYPEPLDIWVEVRAVPNPHGISIYFFEITERRRTEALSARAAQREQLLGRITDELVQTLDPEAAVQRLSQLVVPALADWCVVTLVDDDSEAGSRRGLRHAGAWHADAAMRPLVERYARGRLGALTDDAVIVQAMRSGAMQLIAADAQAVAEPMLAPGPMRDALAALQPEAVAVLPLPGRNGPVGLLTLSNGRARGGFAPEDLITARHVAARAGLVLDGARLYRQQRDLAVGLQRSLLTPPPEPDHAQVVVRYVPAAEAAEVGGDWYDAFLQPNGATVLVIGDVVGHDTEAAAVMAQFRTIVRTLGAQGNDTPVEILRKTDPVLETLQIDTVATAIVARLEQQRADVARGITHLRWSNAGHPPPMVLHPGGRVQVLTGASTDLLLGVTSDAARHENTVPLERDSVVLLYTDGLVERRDQPLDVGLQRLQDTLGELAGLPLDDLCDELLARMLPERPEDDVALVAVRLHPQSRPRPAEAGPNRVPDNVPSSRSVMPEAP